jgi:hypothetical protein
MTRMLCVSYVGAGTMSSHSINHRAPVTLFRGVGFCCIKAGKVLAVALCAPAPHCSKANSIVKAVTFVRSFFVCHFGSPFVVEPCLAGPPTVGRGKNIGLKL